MSTPIEHFEHEVQAETACPYAPGALLQGTHIWNADASFGQNCSLALPELERFAQASAAGDDLDGYIFELPWGFGATLEALALSVRRLLTTIALFDRAGGVYPWQPAREDWQFTFNGCRLFVAAFAPCYSPPHPRWSPHTFIFLQPATSFDRRGIHRGTKKTAAVVAGIRDAFSARGAAYDTDLIAQHVEAYLYVFPYQLGDRPVCWWGN